MDNKHFDSLVRELAGPSTRRRTLRLLAGGLIGGFLSPRGAALVRAAQRSDRDQDGLFDDDETGVYGTNPDLFDTDGDGISDGEEVYRREMGLNGPNDPLTPAGDSPPPGQSLCALVGESCATVNCCTGFCQGEVCECTSDGRECRSNIDCCSGVCDANGFCGGTCGLLGAICNADGDCCAGDYAALCCFDGISLKTLCTDVTNIGYVCPGDPVGPVSCAPGLTDCGGECVDVNVAQFHCGACGYSCGLAGYCQGGYCIAANPGDSGTSEATEPMEPVEPVEPAVSEEERERILSGGGGGAGGGGTAGGGDPCDIEGACEDKEYHEPFPEDHPQG